MAILGASSSDPLAYSTSNAESGCLPDERIRDMKGTSRHSDYELWTQRCAEDQGQLEGNLLTQDNIDVITNCATKGGTRCEWIVEEAKLSEPPNDHLLQEESNGNPDNVPIEVNPEMLPNPDTEKQPWQIEQEKDDFMKRGLFR